MVNTKLNLSMTEPYVRQIYAKEGDTGRVLEIGLDDYPTENGTLRILRPDGVEVTADAIKSAGGDAYKGELVTFDALEEVPLEKLEVDLEPIQDLSHGDPSPSNICPISGHTEVNVYVEPTYDETADPTATVSLGQTVYGGKVDLVSGKLTVDKVEVDMGSLAWGKYADVSPQSVFYVSIADMKKGNAWALSSEYKVRSSWTALNTLEDYTAQTHPSLSVIYVRDDRYADFTSFRNAVNGVQLVYELETPIEVDLTPTQISTLLGENNVWSSGEVEVAFEYDGLFAELPQQATAVVGRCIGDVDFNGASTMPFTLVVKPNNKEQA